MPISILGRSKVDLELILMAAQRPQEVSLRDAIQEWAADDFFSMHFVARRYLEFEAGKFGADPVPALLNPFGKTVAQQLVVEQFEADKRRYMSAQEAVREAFAPTIARLVAEQGLDVAMKYAARHMPDSMVKVLALKNLSDQQELVAKTATEEQPS